MKGDIVDRKSVDYAIEAQECIICATGTSNHMKQDAALVVGMHNILNVRYP